MHEFKSGLFEPLFNTNTSVIPVVLAFKNKNGDFAASASYHQTSLIKSVFQLLSHGQVSVEVVVLPTISPQNYINRKELAKTLYQLMNEHYQNLFKTQRPHSSAARIGP